MPDPIELPAPVLEAAKRSQTFAALLEGWDPETSISRLEITYEEAKAMIRYVVSIHQAGYFPRDMMRAEKKDFPFRGSGGWRFELYYRGRWHPTLTVAASLKGPGYREDQDVELQGEPEFEDRPPPVVLSRDQFMARDYSQGGRR
jgi:hypothetical protein